VFLDGRFAVPLAGARWVAPFLLRLHKPNWIMKKIIPLLVGAVILCGCNKSSDSAKIEALSQKLDAVLQSQSLAISNQIIMDNKLSELPSISYYYYTNSFQKMQKMDSEIILTYQMEKVNEEINLVYLTNIFMRP
jgi:hypothetical protein